ncbi:hypothetical protein RQP46_010362 [Phenoliferia psychrophenolica]
MSLLPYELELPLWGAEKLHLSPSLYPLPDHSFALPAWQLEHLPSSAAPSASLGFSPSPTQGPLDLEGSGSGVGMGGVGTRPRRESLESAVASFSSGTYLAQLLHSPRMGMGQHNQLDLDLEQEMEQSGSGSGEGTDEEEEEDLDLDEYLGDSDSDSDEPLVVTSIAPSSLRLPPLNLPSLTTTTNTLPVSFLRATSSSPPSRSPSPIPAAAVFIAAPSPLSAPRTAHLTKAYPNESDLANYFDSSNNSDLDDHDYDEPLPAPLPRPRKRPSSGSSTLPTPANSPPATNATIPRGRPASKTAPKIRRSTSSVSATSSSSTLPNSSLRKTEQPAVPEDPSIKPYGCCYPSTIKELKVHCARHKKAGEWTGETPFRCALDPCGKTFKSAAGLLWHFTSAAAGHFAYTLEQGESRPSKKFKATLEPSMRSERCPIGGCNKSFKQAAGLAYHLSHTVNHPTQVTEAMVEGFPITLQSKTRWWFKKLKLKIRDDGAGMDDGGGGREDDEEEGEESDED